MSQHTWRMFQRSKRTLTIDGHNFTKNANDKNY